MVTTSIHVVVALLPLHFYCRCTPPRSLLLPLMFAETLHHSHLFAPTLTAYSAAFMLRFVMLLLFVPLRSYSVPLRSRLAPLCSLPHMLSFVPLPLSLSPLVSFSVLLISLRCAPLAAPLCSSLPHVCSHSALRLPAFCSPWIQPPTCLLPLRSAPCLHYVPLRSNLPPVYSR